MDMTKFSAGFARLDITPFLGIPMAGSFTARGVQGILDPLQVNVVAFGDGEKTALLVVADLVGIYGAQITEMIEAVAEAAGVPVEAINLHCTHTHTGPSCSADEQYAAFLKRRLCDAAVMAIADRKPVQDVLCAETQTEGLTCVRRFKLSDGTVMTNPAGEWKKMIVDVAGENDESLRLVRILRQDAKEIDLVNFQSHPDNIGGERVSADFPGAMRRTLEQMHPNSLTLFIQGCEGQMVAFDRRTDHPKASIERATATGVKLAQVVSGMFDSAVSTNAVGLSYGRKAVSLKTKRDSSRVPAAQQNIDWHNEGRDDLIHPIQKFANYILAESRRIVTLEKTGMDYLHTQVCAIAFCGVAFAGFPGEPFNEVGKQVRRNSKFPFTCTLALSNGSPGYFPTAQGHAEGGYEAYNTPYVAGTAEQMADTLDELLAEL